MSLASRLRSGTTTVGYWSVLDSPAATEQLARLGYDYLCLDAQHGLMSASGWRAGLSAIDAGALASPHPEPTRGLVRVPANDPATIGQVLDAGAVGVIVPLVESAEQTAAAVAACRYPPHGRRSYGPLRSRLRIGPDLDEADREVVCLAMIETGAGLAAVEEICAVPGLDGIYVGPVDLRISLGGRSPADPAVDRDLDAALARIRAATRAAGIVAGIHTFDGAGAARRLDEGFTMVSIASDLDHLVAHADAELSRLRRSR